MKNFNKEAWMGTWYEAYRSYSISFQRGDCTTMDYSFRRDGDINIYQSDQRYYNDELNMWRNGADMHIK